MPRGQRRAVDACGCGTIQYDEERFDQDARAAAGAIRCSRYWHAQDVGEPHAGVITKGRVHHLTIFMAQFLQPFPTFGQAQPDVDDHGDGAAVGATS